MAERRFLYACDPMFNSFVRIATDPVVTPGAHALFGVENLSNGLPDLPFVFDSVAADESVTQDLNGVGNWDMTLLDGVVPTFWEDDSVGTGAMTRDATGGESAGPGMRLVSGSGVNFAYGVQDIDVRPGEVLNWTAALKGSGSAPVILRVQNRWNNKYWTGTVWQTAVADLATRTTATFATSTGQITMEDWDDLLWPQGSTVPLRIIVACETASSTVFADTIAVWASWNFFSVHGHAIQPQLAVELRRDSAAFAGAGTLVATLPVYKPSFFYALPEDTALITDRYVRLKLAGTPATPVVAPFLDWFGELILTQYRSLTTRPRYGSSMQKFRDQVRFRGAMGSTRARMLSTMERRTWDADFTDMDPDDLIEFDETLVRLAGYGESAGVFVLDDADPRSCIHGTIPESWEFSESTLNTRDLLLSIVEDPLPSFLS